MKYIFYVLLCLTLSISGLALSGHRDLTPAEIMQLKQAVEDEIYDYGYYNQFYQIGTNTGTPQHWIAEVYMFVNPQYDTVDKHGEVIYKLMPYGQIYRIFYIDSGGEIKLDGDPQNHFPMTQPSRQTVFMDELDVCQREQTWTKTSFLVDTNPTPDMINDAAQRQKKRTGFSDWEYEHPGRDVVKK